MKGYLLDTNAALLGVADPGRLSAAASKAVLRGPNMISVVSFWEVLLKSMKGTLDVGDPRAWWTDTLEQLAATPLQLRSNHVAGVYSLPPLHKDPFDRILIAQASAEDLVMVTADGQIPLYASAHFRVIS